jgi:hypothetical protein
MRTVAAGCLAIFATLAVLVPKAAAEPFAILPDGSLVFNAAFVTSGVFWCGVVPCTGSGTSTVTIGSGTQTTTITFRGVEATAQVGNVVTPVSLGTFEAIASDPAFRFPPHPQNPNAAALYFDLSLSHTSPVPATTRTTYFFGPGGGLDLPLLQARSNWLGAPVGPNPPGFNYTQIIYTLSPFPFSIAGSGLTDLSADAGVVPEPATMALVGTGLAIGAWAGRRRRRHARQ